MKISLEENKKAIIIAALDLARSHTKWKKGENLLKHFSRDKDKFDKKIEEELLDVFEKGYRASDKDKKTGVQF